MPKEIIVTLAGIVFVFWAVDSVRAFLDEDDQIAVIVTEETDGPVGSNPFWWCHEGMGKSFPNCSRTKEDCAREGLPCDRVADAYHWLDLPAPYGYVVAYSTPFRCEMARREMNADYCIKLVLDAQWKQIPEAYQ